MPVLPDLAALGRALRTRRRALDLTQDALAGRAGVHTNLVGRAERGGNVKLETFLKILSGLGVGEAELKALYDAAWSS